jgi:outer membrane PBP1 activator LpoA protein
MRTLSLTLAALLLAACSTPQERAAYMQAQADEMVTVYGPACVRLGYAPNTDQWRACVINLSTKEDLRNYLSYPSYYGPGYWHNGYWGAY